jgi:oligoendopeptidase F
MCWDLKVFYKGIDDPQIAADLTRIEKSLHKFRTDYQGRLNTSLGSAIAAYDEIDQLMNKVLAFLMLKTSQNLTDEKVRSKYVDAEQRLSLAVSENLNFFEHEVIQLNQETLDRQIAADPNLKRLTPFIRSIRAKKQHLLSENIEAALAARAPYGAESWVKFYEEIEAELRFTFNDKNVTLKELLNIMSAAPDPEERAAAQKALNDGFSGFFARYAAQTLNMIAGAKAVEDRERRFAHPMDERNRSNAVPDQVVNALHDAVKETAAPLARRYYRLKGAILGLERMRWSDRNARLPFDNAGSDIPFDQAMRTVASAYQSFSPTMAAYVRQMYAERRIDAPASAGKANGAFCLTIMIPKDRAVSFVLLNYQGSERDVMTLAHELGHAVHGQLAAEAQGSLMNGAPMAYAETASVFGEMIVFDYLRAEAAKKGDKEAQLALLMEKIDDVINTSVRQISFSNFERRVHAAGRRLTVDELNAIWLEVTKEMYGAEGDVFTYENMEYLWVYVPHFHRPFYVYSYAFGELLTHSLYGQRARLGDRFEPLYLDLLRSGGTKNAVDLVRPFGLDPNDPKFWSQGIELSLGAMVQEAERLSRELGYDVP